MEFHPADILISLINIAVLFLLLRLILWKHINRFLSARADRIRAELEDAESRRQSAEELKQEYENKIETIEAQGRDLMRESQIKAAEEAEELLSETREKARVMIQEARQRIEEEKERAVENAHHEIAQLATDMAARILRREVSAGDSQHAVDNFFSETSK